MPASPDLVPSDVMLLEFLDWFRVVAERKLAGLTREQATSIATPSGMTSLGIVKHLAWNERGWFEYHFLGIDRGAVDTDESFDVLPGETVESVIDDYHADIARSREIVDEAASMDQPGVVTHPVFGEVDLRWIVVHMLEETARHAGHLDILTELTDGRVGN